MKRVHLKVHFICEIRIFVTQMVDRSCRPISYRLYGWKNEGRQQPRVNHRILYKITVHRTKNLALFPLGTGVPARMVADKVENWFQTCLKTFKALKILRWSIFTKHRSKIQFCFSILFREFLPDSQSLDHFNKRTEIMPYCMGHSTLNLRLNNQFLISVCYFR